MLLQLSPLQARIIGVLIEKEITTPDQYPLSLNALTLGCNQKSSREPIMQLSESEVQNGLDELRDKNLLFEQQSSGSRVLKYKHRFCNTEFSSLQFTSQQLALVCALLLRGPQTPGELRTRTNRLAQFDNVNEVETSLTLLSDFNGDKIVVKLSREPGKRDSRFAHLFSGDEGLITANAESLSDASSRQSRPQSTVDLPTNLSEELEQSLARIKILEEQVTQITKQLAGIQETLEILSS
ncbi:MAG: hypothetical protein ACJAVV_002201 [Alphaproteobacteria bacterium]|jgi:uncharacterized protein YceH (UPF0502 family)